MVGSIPEADRAASQTLLTPDVDGRASLATLKPVVNQTASQVTCNPGNNMETTQDTPKADEVMRIRSTPHRFGPNTLPFAAPYLNN